jgi:PilZ domain
MSAEAAPAKKTQIFAAIGIDLAHLEFFKTSLDKYGVQMQLATYDIDRPPKNADVNAFIVRVGVAAEDVLTKIRSEEKFRDTLIYAVGTGGDLLNANLSEFEINVLLPDLSAPSVTDAVQSTYQLLLHQLRRYARIPIVTPVLLGTGDNSVRGISRNVSAGGMSLSLLSAGSLDALQSEPFIQVSFSLPHSSRFHLSSVMVRKADKLVNFQFLGSPDQEELKGWIDRYLQK